MLWVVLLFAALVLSGCGDNGPDLAPTATTTADVLPTATEDGGEALPFPDAITPTPVPSPVGLSEEDRVSVYAGVVDAMLGSDLGTPTIFISPYLGQGEFLDNPDESTPVPASLMERLEPEYPDRRFEVRDFSEAIDPLEEGGRVKNGGIFITLGPILNDPARQDAVSVRASYYRGVGDARGDIYHFQRDSSAPDGWKSLGFNEEWNYQSVEGTEVP